MTRRVSSSSSVACLFLALAVVRAPSAFAQTTPAVAVPATPAGTILTAWLDAFNSGDSVRVLAYIKQYQPQMPSPQGWLQLRANTGGFDLVKILASEPRHIEFLLKEKSSASYGRGMLDVADGEPLAAKNFGIRLVPPGAPPEGCKTYQTLPARISTAADPKDVVSQDAILAALYDAISGPACQRRDWDRFRSLFAPGARLIPTGRGPDGAARARAETPDEYATAAKQGLEENGFFEHEIARTGETFGSITHAFSTYESRRTAADAKPFARGINSIQLLNDGTRWWIVTVYWQGERPDSPIPAEYLKRP